jgi:hypothetical protein
MNREQGVADLIERYLFAVELELPARLRADVSKELRSLVQDALEDRVAAAGRPADKALTADVLRGIGEPWVVARRYVPGPHHLIGPQLYPMFVRVLKIVLAATAILVALTTGLPHILQPTRGAGLTTLAGWFATLSLYFHMAVAFFAATVIVFALIERRVIPSPEAWSEWDPRDLPEVPEAEPGDRFIVPQVAARIGFAVLALVLVHVFLDRLGLLMLDGEAVRLVPLGAFGVRLPIAWIDAWCLGSIALSLVVLWQRRWTNLTRWCGVGLSLLGAVVAYLTAAGSSIEVPPGLPRLAGLRIPLNMALYAPPFAILLATVVRAGQLLHRQRRDRSTPASAAQGPKHLAPPPV